MRIRNNGGGGKQEGSSYGTRGANEGGKEEQGIGR